MPEPKTLAGLPRHVIQTATARIQAVSGTRSPNPRVAFLARTAARRTGKRKFPSLRNLPYSVGARGVSGVARGGKGFTGGQLEGSLLGGGDIFEPPGGRQTVPRQPGVAARRRALQRRRRR